VGTRFSELFQTGPGAHLASYTMGTGSFSRVKGRGVVFTTHLPSSAEVKERVKLQLRSSLWAFVDCFRVKFYYTGKSVEDHKRFTEDSGGC